MAGLWKISSLRPTSASTFSRVSIFVLRFRIPFAWGFFFVRLSHLKHLFGHFIKTYYSSIIPIALYLTYFTVLDIVSLLCVAPLHRRLYHVHLYLCTMIYRFDITRVSRLHLGWW